MALQVSIKHAGKVYDNVPLDSTRPASTFKNEVYQRTGVPPDRMKIMVKGGLLKDDSDWSKIGPKAGQTFMVLGTAGELPKPPAEKIIFIEDMTDSQLADALQMPIGLTNLGNTCYMNATVQVLRGVPELHSALDKFQGRGDLNKDLISAMRDLYKDMGKTTEGMPPFRFLQVLRQVEPRFAEMRQGSYAQQDADECWVQILNSLTNGPLSGLDTPDAAPSGSRFVDQYLAGEMTQTYTCDEAPEEPPTIQRERILKLDCNISLTTNYLGNGILDSLNQKIIKNSPTLGRDATYSQTSRVSRLPMNLTVHMVRFYWRQDIQKKAKIMRKVKFPFELDVLDMVTPELKAKLVPLNSKLKEIEKERDERRKVRRKTKAKAQEDAAVAAVSTQVGAGSSAPATEDIAMDISVAPVAGTIEDEKSARDREVRILNTLVDPDLVADVGSSPHGLYELCGIVTHKGASAEGGHYIGWVKKDTIDLASSKFDKESSYDDAKDEWYKFDDDRVSVVKQEKITTLDGGGEDSTAYILLYRSKSLV